MIRNFENGDIITSARQFVTGPEATGKGVRHRVRMFLGEYFLDTSDGTDFYDAILGKHPAGVAEAELKQRILSSPGVYDIADFDLTSDRQARKITVKCTIIDVNNERLSLTMNEAV